MGTVVTTYSANDIMPAGQPKNVPLFSCDGLERRHGQCESICTNFYESSIKRYFFPLELVARLFGFDSSILAKRWAISGC